jgi:hypothetical protein
MLTLCRVLALGTALALAIALPAIGAEDGEPASPQTSTETSNETSTETPTEATTVATPTPQASSLVVVRDPETGAFRAPTAEEAAAMNLDLEPLARSDAGLRQIFRDHGGVSVVLDGRFQNTSVVHRNADGEVTRHTCATAGEATGRTLETGAEEEVTRDDR